MGYGGLRNVGYGDFGTRVTVGGLQNVGYGRFQNEDYEGFLKAILVATQSFGIKKLTYRLEIPSGKEVLQQNPPKIIGLDLIDLRLHSSLQLNQLSCSCRLHCATVTSLTLYIITNKQTFNALARKTQHHRGWIQPISARPCSQTETRFGLK